MATPTIIALATLAGRRWGPSVSGWIAGIPLTSGPLALYFALEQGTAFAANAAIGILAGLIAVAAFCIAYARLAARLPWFVTILAALLMFTGVTAILRTATPGLAITTGCVAAAIVLALLLLPDRGRRRGISVPPRWDIPLRMVLATLIVVGLTSFAPLLGPRLAGLLAPVPVYAGLMTVFAHHFEGPDVAVEVLRGVLYGTFGFGAFFLCVAAMLLAGGIATAFVSATAAALFTQAATYRLLRPTTAVTPTSLS